jgi:hypothetical protein
MLNLPLQSAKTLMDRIPLLVLPVLIESCTLEQEKQKHQDHNSTGITYLTTNESAYMFIWRNHTIRDLAQPRLMCLHVCDLRLM